MESELVELADHRPRPGRRSVRIEARAEDHYLANSLQGGDFKPTNHSSRVQKDLEDKLKTLQGQVGDVLGKDVTTLNERMKGTGLPGIAVSPSRRPSSD